MEFPDMPATYEMTRSVPDHEILLVFNGDEDALNFREWLEEHGWKLFQSAMKPRS